jgi:hypothetical protein
MKNCRALLLLMMIAVMGLMTAPFSMAEEQPKVSPLFTMGGDATTALLNDTSVLSNLKTVKDYANLYYKNCVAYNPDLEMNDYIQSQCACAAATMPDLLTLPETRAMFDPRNTDVYPFTRFILLGYNDCLPETVRDVVYDKCLKSEFGGRRMKARKNTCVCIADGLKNYVTEYGAWLMPGNTGDHYDALKVPGNPISAVMDNIGFQMQAEGFEKTCLAREEYGW